MGEVQIVQEGRVSLDDHLLAEVVVVAVRKVDRYRNDGNMLCPRQLQNQSTTRVPLQRGCCLSLASWVYS